MKASMSATKGAGSINHNDRSFIAKNVDRSRTKDNITLCAKDIQETYKKLFGDALTAYNSKQKRSDRVIKDYYEKIRHSRQEKPFYEMIIQIGNKDNSPYLNRQATAILKDFYEDFVSKYNSNIEVVGAYIHMDEATPHLHLDYIPVCHNQKRGLETKNSHSQAMKELGYQDGDYRKWRADIVDNLEAIALNYGIERDIIQNEPRPHMKIDEYKETMAEVDQLKQTSKQLDKGITSKKKTLKSIEADISQLEPKKREVDKLEAKHDELIWQNRELEESIENNTETLTSQNKAINDNKQYLSSLNKEIAEKERSEPFFKALYDKLEHFVINILAPRLPQSLQKVINDIMSKDNYEDIDNLLDEINQDQNSNMNNPNIDDDYDDFDMDM